MYLLPYGIPTDIPEEWFPITEFYLPGINPYYEASNYGRIRNKVTNTFLPQCPDETHYNDVGFSFKDGSRRTFRVHRIIAMIFVYNDYDFNYDREVNHKDGVKGHNWAWNLEWVTHEENIHHCINTGLMSLGEERDNSVFTDEQVNFICQLIADGKSASEIANIVQIDNFSVQKLVQNIKNGHCWKHISKNYDFSNAFSRFNFTDDDIHKMCKIFEIYGTNISYKQVLTLMGVDYSDMDDKKLACLNSCICGIRSKKRYKEICSQYNY